VVLGGWADAGGAEGTTPFFCIDPMKLEAYRRFFVLDLQCCFCENPRGFLQLILFLYFMVHFML
jgi:hypothetical protein